MLLLFWGVMTFLLWRSEYGGGEFGTPVPVQTVWERMLTAPDDSALEIRHGRERVGRVTWSPNVGQELATGKVNDLAAEGQVRQAAYYTIDLDGYLRFPAEDRSVRFSSQARFGTNHQWQLFNLRVAQRPDLWSLAADTTNRTIELSARLDDVEWSQVIGFDELRNPARLLTRMGAPWAAALLAGALPGGEISPERLAAGARWEARQDWFELGHTRLRAYRLTWQLTETLRVQLFISRAGEILRADLPDRWTLLNDKFLGY